MKTTFDNYEPEDSWVDRIPPWMVAIFKKLGYIIAYVFGAWLIYLLICLVALAYFREWALTLPIQVFWGIPQVMGAEAWEQATAMWSNPWFP